LQWQWQQAATVVAPWHQASSEGVMESARAVAASSTNDQFSIHWQMSSGKRANQTINQKSNNQPLTMVMARTEQAATAVTATLWHSKHQK